MKKPIDRRHFIKTTAAGTVAAGLGQITNPGFSGPGQIPYRLLGNTGVRVPILGFGTVAAGHRRDLTSAIALYNEAIDRGINYFDTAPEYTGYGRAQFQLGYVMRERRKEVFLVTKCAADDADTALKILEQNLRELQTDHADLVYAHSIGDDGRDVDQIVGKGGVLEGLLYAKQQGMTRFIGVSGHCRAARFLRVLQSFPIDVMMNAVSFIDHYTYNFEEVVWPTAAQLGVGLAAMKVFGGGVNRSDLPAELLPIARRYAWSVPEASLAVIGMGSQAELQSNIDAAINFTPLTDEERAALEPIARQWAARWQERYGPIE